MGVWGVGGVDLTSHESPQMHVSLYDVYILLALLILLAVFDVVQAWLEKKYLHAQS